MQKIPTIFERDRNGHRGVVPTLSVSSLAIQYAVATEKVDGTNVRVTMRNGHYVRLEKRRNPPKVLKEKGVIEPWYVDTLPGSPEDHHIYAAVTGTLLSEVPDGEWSAEAVGPKIQGNPLGLDEHRLFFFDADLPESVRVPVLKDVPQMWQAPSLPTSQAVLEWWFDALRAYLETTPSHVGKGKMEGIVWRGVGKLKLKDYREAR